MLKYIGKRLLAMIPVVLGVTLIVYCIMSLAPGDPARTILGEQASVEQVEALREEMGLNDPIIVQYLRYIWNLLHGDFGTSYQSRIDVSTEIWSRFPNTIKLALVASLISVVLALPLGIIAAVKQNTFFDSFSMFIAIIGISCPTFWFGLILILVFAVNLKWFPVSGQVNTHSACSYAGFQQHGRYGPCNPFLHAGGYPAGLYPYSKSQRRLQPECDSSACGAQRHDSHRYSHWSSHRRPACRRCHLRDRFCLAGNRSSPGAIYSIKKHPCCPGMHHHFFHMLLSGQSDCGCSLCVH